MKEKMNPASEDEAIRQLLYRLGVTEAYVGFLYVVHAVQMCVSDPTRLQSITNLIYPDIAEKYGTNIQAVERNIRTLVSAVWRLNPELLSALSAYSLTRKPTNGRFLSILASAIREKNYGSRKQEAG